MISLEAMRKEVDENNVVSFHQEGCSASQPRNIRSQMDIHLPMPSYAKGHHSRCSHLSCGRGSNRTKALITPIVSKSFCFCSQYPGYMFTTQDLMPGRTEYDLRRWKHRRCTMETPTFQDTIPGSHVVAC